MATLYLRGWPPNLGPLLRVAGRLRQVTSRPRLGRGDRFDRFTTPARGVLRRAQEEAQRLGHHWIGTEHLMLGLVGEEHGTAAQAPKVLGVSGLLALRQEVDSIIRANRPTRSGVSEAGPPQHVGLTPRAKRVIELSVEEARRLNHHYVGTEHVLLGLLREGQGIGSILLERRGVGLEGAREQVLRILEQRGRERD